jgi:hypothetical protein
MAAAGTTLQVLAHRLDGRMVRAELAHEFLDEGRVAHHVADVAQVLSCISFYEGLWQHVPERVARHSLHHIGLLEHVQHKVQDALWNVPDLDLWQRSLVDLGAHGHEPLQGIAAKAEHAGSSERLAVPMFPRL